MGMLMRRHKEAAAAASAKNVDSKEDEKGQDKTPAPSAVTPKTTRKKSTTK